jgi:hypothetical protein
MLFVINGYVLRADPSWGNLLARAAVAALVAGAEPRDIAPVSSAYH